MDAQYRQLALDERVRGQTFPLRVAHGDGVTDVHSEIGGRLLGQQHSLPRAQGSGGQGGTPHALAQIGEFDDHVEVVPGCPDRGAQAQGRLGEVHRLGLGNGGHLGGCGRAERVESHGDPPGRLTGRLTLGGVDGAEDRIHDSQEPHQHCDGGGDTEDRECRPPRGPA